MGNIQNGQKCGLSPPNEDWSERKEPDHHQFALQKKYQAIFNELAGGRTLVFGAPAIPGLGAVAGFAYVLQDTQSRGAQELAAMLGSVLMTAKDQPEISRAFPTFSANYPQIWLEVDRVKATSLGVSLSDLFLTLQTQLGGLYVNDFNLFGKTYRVMVQAETEFRQQEDDLANLYVTNKSGAQIPLSTLVTTAPVQGADVLYRYNTYDSATINGTPNTAAGYSSGDAMAAMESLSTNVLGPGFKFDWTDSSYEERKSGNMAPIALGLSLPFTYLFLVALYESFMTPFSIILSVPIAMIGGLAGLLIMSESLSLYGQIGMILLVGTASKSAILIVEFAKNLREAEGLELQQATMESARLRFRPVMMTGLSFVAGVLPLVVATGAGAASQVSLGLSVFGGTIMTAIGGTLLVSVFFKLFQGAREKFHGGRTAPPE